MYKITSKKSFIAELKLIFQSRYLFMTLVKRNIRLQYKNWWIGATWAFFQPLVLTSIFYIFLRNQLGNSDQSYFIFLLIGFSLWSFFAGATQLAADSFLSNRTIIGKAAFPLILLPVAAVTSKLFDLALVVLLLLASLFLINTDTSWLHFTVSFFAAVVSIFLFAVATGILLGLITVRYRDVKIIIPFLIQILLFLTPVFYSPEILSNYPLANKVYMLNPIAGGIDLVRASVYESASWTGFIGSFVVALISLFISMLYYKAAAKKIPDYL